MEIVGQDRIINKINSFTTSTLPKTIMIEGEDGSGKHLITNYIAQHINREVIDISDRLNLDTITEITLSPLPYIYLIDCSNITTREQNIILKFIEEPSLLSNIVLLSTNSSSLLSTITNRCYQLRLEVYDKETLKMFLPEGVNEDILNYVSTPGQFITLNNNEVESIMKLADTMIDKIDSASIANTFTIASKFNLDKKSEDKFNFPLLLRILNKKLFDKIKELGYNKHIKAYEIVNDTLGKLNTNCDKQRLFDKFLLDFKFALK